MPKSKTRTAIYHPPKKGMPYLVVTVSPEGAVAATAVDSKDEAPDARVVESQKCGDRYFGCMSIHASRGFFLVQATVIKLRDG